MARENPHHIASFAWSAPGSTNKSQENEDIRRFVPLLGQTDQVSAWYVQRPMQAKKEAAIAVCN
jgi:hypothetical protein